MAGKPSKPMTPFDKSVTPSYLYKLKLFLSFLPPSTQRFLAVYIKFSELRYTMDYFRGLPFHAFSFQSIGELAPYMDENERNMMDQMTSMLHGNDGDGTDRFYVRRFRFLRSCRTC